MDAAHAGAVAPAVARTMTAIATEMPHTAHLRGFVQLASGQAVARGMTFLAVAYLARVLGVETFGVIGFAAVVAAYVLQVVDAGLDLVGMREIAHNERRLPEILSGVLGLRLVLAVVAGLLLVGLAPRLAPSPAAVGIMLAYGLSFVSFAANLKWGFLALEHNGPVAAAAVLSQALYLGGIVLFIHQPGDALRVPLLFFGGDLAGAALLFVLLRRRGVRLPFPRVTPLAWRLLREALPLGGARAARAASVNFDLLLLGLVAPMSVVGLYSALSRLILLLREIGELYYLPLFPGLARAAKETAERFASVAHAGLRYAGVIIFPLAVGGCLTGHELLALLFGREYAGGGPALCLLLAAAVVMMLTGAFRLALVAYGRHGTVLKVILAGAAVNVVMNLLLTPRYFIVGAALSVLFSEALILVLAAWAVARSVPLSPLTSVFRPALAAGGMALLLHLVTAWPLWLKVGVGAASYGILILALRAVLPSELADAWRDGGLVPAARTEIAAR